MSHHASALISNTIGSNEIRISSEKGAILLVGGERGKTKQCQGSITGTFGWKKIAVMSPTVAVYKLHPSQSESFELCDLQWIDDVCHHAGDHSGFHAVNDDRPVDKDAR
jgi:hypothetical protein